MRPHFGLQFLARRVGELELPGPFRAPASSSPTRRARTAMPFLALKLFLLLVLIVLCNCVYFAGMPKESPLFLASKNVMSPKFKGDFTCSLKWGIEFTHPKDGVTQLSVIYSFAKEEGVFSRVTFGPLVAVADAGNEIVNLIVEKPQEKCWLKLKFPAVCYSIKFNLERVGTGLVSVLGCGLFPSFLKTKDVLGQKGEVPMKAKEFESGFARVARWMPQND